MKKSYSMALLLFLLSTVTYADDSFRLATAQLEASFLSANPSLLGGEVGATWLIPPVTERAFWVGPRVGASWVGGSTQSRLDFQFGVESVLWLANAIGSGIEFDCIAPSQTYSGSSSFGNATHFRVVPKVAMRFSRFQEDGAWALRVGIPYDTLYQWGISLGVSLQWSGVPGGANSL